MQDDAGEIEGARASFSEGLRLRPDYAPIYHAWARLEGRLGNPGFADKAPADVVEATRAQLAEKLEQKATLDASIAELEKQ